MFIKQKNLQKASQYISKVSSESVREIKAQFDSVLKDNMLQRDRFTVVCGPCSADDPVALEQYLRRLKSIADKCERLLVVARIYTAKPHSNGKGYKGSAFHLTADENVDLDEGILRCRKMMLHCIELGLPVADELLYPELYECFKDLVSYWFVGARSSEDALHRNLASGLDVVCGVKNSTDGDVEKVADSLYAIGSPNVFPYCGAQVATSGNKYAHIVLRGGFKNGIFTNNISVEDVAQAKKLLCNRGLNDYVMADLNHANSGKIAQNQIENAAIALKSGVDGIMMESYLYSGSSYGRFGMSQTDDCLDIENTELLLRQINAYFENKR